MGINFFAIRAFQLLTRLDRFTFTIPLTVEQQFRRFESRNKQLRSAKAVGDLVIVDEILPPDLMTIFGEVTDRLGNADASVLVYGLHLQGDIATDDGRLRIEALRRGVQRVWCTEDLLAEAVLTNMLSINQATAVCTVLDHPPPIPGLPGGLQRQETLPSSG